MLKANKEKGFTIIEVVLVLAIAGLIFLVVFLALPALQRSQRDTARRQDVGKVVSALQSYMSDNKNALPTSTSGFTNYYGSLAQAGSGVAITASGTSALVSSAKLGTGVSEQQVQVYNGVDCDGNSNARKAAVFMKLESSGVGYCESV